MSEDIICNDCGALLLPDERFHWESCEANSGEVSE